MFLDDEDRIGAVMSVDVADGLVQTIRGVTNPDKLEHLGPVLDAREVLRKDRR
jgi:RNA polymerase sigma-70 factor (ECF subfamily)